MALKSLGENIHSGPSSCWHIDSSCSTHRWDKLYRGIFKKGCNEKIGQIIAIRYNAQSYKHTEWWQFACDWLLISFLFPIFPHLSLPDLLWFSLSLPLPLPLNSQVIGFSQFHKPLLVGHDNCHKVPQGPLQHPIIFMLVFFPLSYQLQSSGQLPSRLCLSVFLVAHQPAGEEFWSLLLSLLSSAPQVCVSVCLIYHFLCYLLFLLYWVVLNQIT